MIQPSIVVCVPAYDGKVTVETAQSLQAEQYAAQEAGIKFAINYSQQDPIIHRARNLMVREFMKTDCTDMIFVDADVGFEQGTLLRLASHPVDLVGAVYPKRKEPLEFPVGWIQERAMLVPDAGTGLLEVKSIPSGCMRISRKLIQALIDQHPEWMYYNFDGGKSYALFDFERVNNIMFGEDVVFCKRARDAGFKVWADPMVNMTHTGHKVFEGNLGKWLLSRDAEPQQEAA